MKLIECEGSLIVDHHKLMLPLIALVGMLFRAGYLNTLARVGLDPV